MNAKTRAWRYPAFGPQTLSRQLAANTFTRRDFLGTAAAGCAGLACQAAVGSEAKKVIVGGCAWIYSFGLPNHDITPILDTVFAEMEYAEMEGIEVMQTTLRPDNSVERLEALAEKHHVPVVGASFVGAMWDRKQHQAILEEAEMVISRLGQLGGRRLGVTVGAPQGATVPKTTQQFDDQADVLRKLMAICSRHGVVLDLHNHTYEVKDDQFDLRNTLKRISEMKLGPDLGWLHEAGIDSATFIREHGPRLVFLHLRDQHADGTWAQALGEGDMDYVEIGQALREVDFHGYAVIELTQTERQTRPTRENHKISRKFVREVLGY